MFNEKRLLIEKGIITGIISVIIGILFVFIPSSHLVNALFIIIGLFIVIESIFPFFAYWNMANNDPKYLTLALMSTVSLIIGFMFIFWHNFILSIILGIWLVVLPLIRIIFSEDKVNQIKKEIPFFLVAILLFFIPASNIIDIVMKVFGGLFILFGIVSIIYWLIWYKKKDDNDNNNGDRVIIDAKIKEL